MKVPELLSPVGDFECLKAAVQNGANSVYLGASSFSARAKATNFDKNELIKAIRYAKLRNVTVHLALNTLIKNNEFEDAVKLAIDAYNIGVDAIIIQDLGLAKFLLENYPEIPLHASTQMTVHNLFGVKQLEKFGFSRVVLSRELSLNEIQYIRNNTSIELEVFVHGALCISYSGQCLLSSMIGGRSGNRGLCAQPCRLPYELCSSNGPTLDKGFILSPRDLSSIMLLPELIKSGIDSFKIEGRMKTPLYVATVTKIYRKYIDLVLNNINKNNDVIQKIIDIEFNKKNNNTGLSDKEELAQVFNRGGFSTGHLKNEPNRNLIFKDKPNNMGIFVGKISNFNSNKGHIKLKLEDSLSIGDKISINNETYTISELMINNKNFETLTKGNNVTIGRMKGKISIGNKVYRIEKNTLSKSISPTFKENKNFKKIPLKCEIIIKKGLPLSLKIWSDIGVYKNLEYTATSSVIPVDAIKQPITKEKIIEQISKTGNTEFEFTNINVVLDDNLFIPKTSSLNDLRRSAIEGLENLVIKLYSHNLEIKNEFKYVGCHCEYSNNLINLKNNHINNIEKNDLKHQIYNKKISLLLNILNTNFDYTSVKHIDKLYIPYRYFNNKEYSHLLLNLTSIYNTYIYMPFIIKDKFQQKLLDNIINKFNIKGFVISHISQIELISKYNLELIGNYNLNIYNNYSIDELENLNINTFTLSPELDIFEIQNLIENTKINSEIIAYGKIPVMTNNYCYLGKSNKCYKECDKKCLKNDIYYLKDRLDSKFRIVPDNSSTITTIYNNKSINIQASNINSTNIRIDILDENIEEINEIIDNYTV